MIIYLSTIVDKCVDIVDIDKSYHNELITVLITFDNIPLVRSPIFRHTISRMVNLSQSVCFKFAEARRKEGLSQSALAEEVGCMQSAISMFEKGNVTKLSEETIQKLSKRLNVPLQDENTSLNSNNGDISFTNIVYGFCPDCSCPSNVPYLAGGRLFFRPSRHLASPAGGKRCALCGEVLELRCPVCGAALNDGACCGICGTAYVTPVIPEGTDPVIYTRMRVDEIAKFRSLN